MGIFACQLLTISFFKNISSSGESINTVLRLNGFCVKSNDKKKKER
jgi:hypothetical protein